jgi:predicted Zn finger-like uncharacterized protein
MPTTACPECGARSRVRAESVGLTVRCPHCRERFTAAAAPVSVRRLLRPDHAAGWWLGVLLLAAAPALAAPAAWAAVHASAGLHQALYGQATPIAVRISLYAALACTAVGAWLVSRWRRSRRP